MCNDSIILYLELLIPIMNLKEGVKKWRAFVTLPQHHGKALVSNQLFLASECFFYKFTFSGSFPVGDLISNGSHKSDTTEVT